MIVVFLCGAEFSPNFNFLIIILSSAREICKRGRFRYKS